MKSATELSQSYIQCENESHKRTFKAKFEQISLNWLLICIPRQV